MCREKFVDFAQSRQGGHGAVPRRSNRARRIGESQSLLNVRVYFFRAKLDKLRQQRADKRIAAAGRINRLDLERFGIATRTRGAKIAARRAERDDDEFGS